ncbi:MAG: M28 family peptidase [Gemmatimonadota bacterium]|nr:MAG: M28 family peptidase [Gemmatimonadota bacterium]
MNMGATTSCGLLTLSLAAALGCAPGEGPSGDGLEGVLASITAEKLSEHIQVLASDEFEGRLPGTPGEEKTIAYLVEEFERIGLQPGNRGSWVQEVPLVSITADPNTRLTVTGDGETKGYAYGDEVVAWTKRVVDSVNLEDSELVFVGYGTVAPEYDWNDYEGLDVRGKTVVVLVNDPGFATQKPELFNGRSMTYYGRWTYKYEEAARQGAAAAFIVHQTEPAAYGWDVVEGSWTGPQFDMVREDNNMSRVQIEGWLSEETARDLFERAGQDLEALKAQALTRDFEPVDLGLTVSMSLTNTIARSESNNVVALLPGSDRPDEYVIYMSHWDHLGRDTLLEGDQIRNGALDNASGTAALLELAEAFTALNKRPARSIVFIPVTAEEQGLLGSAYYAANPVFPPDKTVAAINMDGLNIIGPMKDIVIVGYGNSELDDYLIAAAETQGRAVVPDPDAEKGYFYRSDQFSLAKVGIPALYTDTGDDHVEHGVEWTRQRKDEWIAKHYHKPSDEYSPEWDLRGAVEDVQLLFRVGYRLANQTSFPNWREGNEFKARRDAMMSGTH